MNRIVKVPIPDLGYNFVAREFLREGGSEYDLRNASMRAGVSYRNLSAYEIEVLVRNNNTSDNWNHIEVSNAFNPELVKNCKFYGLVRIGKLENIALRFHNVTLPVGLYNSTIISCDLGDNIVLKDVNYISHYILGNEVMLSNIQELHCTDHAKFGNGILREGEDEKIRIWVEVCNENAGRKIMPFNGMLTGDASLWAHHRADQQLQDKFAEFTNTMFTTRRGTYGYIGDRTVIKNTGIIKDMWIGTDAYIKGANKLKNLTLNSSAEAASQIGEGCEIVNGIIGYGCRIFYGVKAVRFIMGDHSQLKYGARLINSYLGENSTISCCEVLNSLIFPAHEQHHNNSFLCAALVMGQSNIAAGATIGSNHNSRAADGEIRAERGFWPGLCVSLKHNSKFAAFTLIGKGDYQNEINLPLPFCLVSNCEVDDELHIMPAYWFMYNFYALARNTYKYGERDKRKNRIQNLEFDYLAPDTAIAMMEGMKTLELLVGKASGSTGTEQEVRAAGLQLLSNDPARVKSLEIFAQGWENSRRKVRVLKALEAWQTYKKMLRYYVGRAITLHLIAEGHNSLNRVASGITSDTVLHPWQNLGGQLFSDKDFQHMLSQIRNGEIRSWQDVHEFYRYCANHQTENYLRHALMTYMHLEGLDHFELTDEALLKITNEVLSTRTWIVEQIYASRAKDYSNPFRTMLYDSPEEMNTVVGALEDNAFINQQRDELANFKTQVERLTSKVTA